MKTKLTTVLISFFSVLLSSPSFSFQYPEEQPASDSDAERIIVYGQKSLGQIKNEITKSTRNFFKDYNKLNKNRQFSVICKKDSRPGSAMKVEACEPFFVKAQRSDRIANIMNTGDSRTIDVGAMAGATSIKKSGNTSDESVFDLSKLSMFSDSGRAGISQNKKFSQHIQKLMLENPELLKSYTEVLELQAEYAQRKVDG